MGNIDAEKMVFFAKENGSVIEHLVGNGHEPIIIDSVGLPYIVIYKNFRLDLTVKIDYFIDCLSGQVNIGNFQIAFSCCSYNDFVDFYSQCVEIASFMKESGMDCDFFAKPKSAFLYRNKELVCMETGINNINASISFILIFSNKLNFLITNSSYFGNPDDHTIKQKFNKILSLYKGWKSLFNGNEIFSLPDGKFFPSKVIYGTKIVSIKEHLNHK